MEKLMYVLLTLTPKAYLRGGGGERIFEQKRAPAIWTAVKTSIFHNFNTEDMGGGLPWAPYILDTPYKPISELEKSCFPLRKKKRQMESKAG